MELGLSLGDASKPFGFLKENGNHKQKRKQQKTSIKKGGLDFCMDLGLNSTAVGNQEMGKNKKSQEIDEENGVDEDIDQTSEGDGISDDINELETSLQLNLLPLGPAVPTQISSHLLRSMPWSSDNGSSENDSSGSKGPPPVMGLAMNRTTPVSVVAEEVSSANNARSPFRMGFGMYRNTGANGNDVVEGERSSFRTSDEDDDENGLNARKKLRLSKEQSAFLEERFKEHSTLNPKQKLALAKQLHLRPRQVEVWFQNRRARTKLKQTEVDCEYLKRCRETLSEENRRLHKELQDLRALKTSNPFYMQRPATTLTMCPSCERVAAAPPPKTDTNSAVTVAIGGKNTIVEFNAKPIPIFYPFSQTPTRSNQSAAS